MSVMSWKMSALLMHLSSAGKYDVQEFSIFNKPFQDNATINFN